jgi:hypothetical protein
LVTAELLSPRATGSPRQSPSKLAAYTCGGGILPLCWMSELHRHCRRHSAHRVPILNTWALADYGVPKNVFNQACLVRRRRMSSDTAVDVVCCTGEAASQHAVASQHRIMLVVL